MVSAKKRSMTNPRVLIADDDPEMLALLTMYAEELGASVVLARDGDELLNILASDVKFDLIITDVAMPWMTGPQVLHFARAAGDQTSVIVITARREAWIPKQVDALGDDAVLLYKPFSPIELQTAVSERLAS